jgi:mRNA-degrading endonuclease toxin of MazEF toxin-antitoxin module
VMVDKATTVPRAKIGSRFGQVDQPTLQAVNQALRGFLGI